MTEAWEKNPDYEQGVGLLQTDPAAAVVKLKAAAAFQPRRSRVQANLGLALLNLGEHQEAIAHIRTAKNLTPEDEYVRLRMVDALLRAEMFEELAAETADPSSLQFEDPNDENFTCVARVWALLKTSKRQAAMALSLQAVERWPEDAEAWAARASAFASMCQWDSAFKAIERAKTLRPDDARFAQREQQIVDFRHQTETAIAEAETETEKAPKDAEAWRDLAVAQASGARLNEAAASFDRANTLAKPDADDEFVVAVEASVRSALTAGDQGPVP